MHRHLTVLALLVLASCTTTYLWNETDPYVLVSQKDITETELLARNLNYVRDDQFGVFFVQKQALEKYTDYAIRVVGTPVTVAVDAATTIVVVGGGFYLAAYSNSGDPFAFIAGMMEVLAETAPQRHRQPVWQITNEAPAGASRP